MSVQWYPNVGFGSTLGSGNRKGKKPVQPEASVQNLVPTEQINPRTRDIDLLPTQDILVRINQEDALVHQAVNKAIPQITKVVDKIVEAFRKGGRLFYYGAGTSGRLGVLDASECPPTYSTPPGMVIGSTSKPSCSK